mmetsp:Transcript_92397/g.238525  ORF Transcript_92397/g.238525 Transcript_92397/m.238525 type:complete len:271 (-) Transcript_92397:282-1094(-)
MFPAMPATELMLPSTPTGPSAMPESWRYSAMLPMTLHGMVPKMPCRIITQKVGMRKNCSRLLTSSHTARQMPPSPDGVGASARGGSFISKYSRADTTRETAPMRTKATRQPWMPRISLRAIGTTTRLVMNMPNISELWTRPKSLPRLDSAVMSAMMPFEMGRSAASKAPLRARRKIMGPRIVITASIHVTAPWPSDPMIRMVLRSRMPRSARMPQKGAAMFVHTAWAVFKYARSVILRPTSSCRASIAAGSSAVSAPSRAAVAQSKNCIR